MSEWKSIKGGWDEETGLAVYHVTKGSKELNRHDHDELEQMLRESQAGLYEALLEAEKDLVAAQVNARRAAENDPRWTGVAEAIQPSIDRSRAARLKARDE